MYVKSKPVRSKTNSKVFLKSKRSDATIVSEAVDVVSSTSQSSFGEVMARRKGGAFEKVNSWLNRGQDGNSTHNQAECCTINSKYSPSSLEYPFISNKVQLLLCYGEYSVFTKWLVVVEGDFVQIRFNATKRTEFVKNTSQTVAEVTSLKIQKKKKSSLREIRTLALTKNWLIICNMQRIYQVEKDTIVPAGIILQLRRLVPLKYLNVCVSRSAQRVISIASQSGLVKEYQLIEKTSTVESELFEKWQTAIKGLTPNHDDEKLLLTMQMYERWNRQHSCRITLHPENREANENSIFDFNRKRTKRPAPPPPIESEKQSVQNPQKSSDLSKLSAADPVQEKLFLSKQLDKKVPQVSSKNFQSCAKEDQSFPSKNQEISKPNVRRQNSRKKANCPKSEITKDEAEREQSFSASPTPTMTETTFSDLISGCETSIGPSDCMTYDQTSEPVAGIEASVGLSRPITPDNEFQYGSEPGSSNADKRPKRSVKDVFKMGLFLSKKNKKKNSLAPSFKRSVSESRPPEEPSREQKMKRRTSRLEMGVPIEEVFSGFEFATIERKPISFRKSDSDSDIVEDPDELVAVERQTSSRPLHGPEHDYLSFENSYTDSRENVQNQQFPNDDLT